MVPNSKSVGHSPTWTFFEGDWHKGNVPIVGPRTHGLWLGSTVFDGARAFHGVAPVSLSETQSGWQVESNWVMLLVDALAYTESYGKKMRKGHD